MTTEAIAKAFGIDPTTIDTPISTVNLKNEPETEYLLAMVEKIHWNKPAACMPDADETVMIFLPKDDEPVWFGFFDGNKWHLADGFPLADNEVTYWTPMPRGPQ